MGKGFSSGDSSLKRSGEARPDADKRKAESTFVHFRQLFQKGGMRLLSVDTTGKDEHMALFSGEAGKGGTFSVLPCLYGDMKEGMIFQGQKTSTFVN